MSGVDPEIRARVSTLRSGFLARAGGTKTRAKPVNSTVACSAAQPHDPKENPRQRTVVSTLCQPPVDDSNSNGELISYTGPTTTYKADSHIGGKKFMEYSWSKPLRQPGARTKRKKKGLPRESRMQMLSPEDVPRMSKSLDLPRPSVVGHEARSNASALDLRAVGHSPDSLTRAGGSGLYDLRQRQQSDGDSPWLGESSMESIGDESLGDQSADSLGGDLGMSDGDDSKISVDGGGYESADSVTSLKDILDRKKEALSEVEALYNNVKQKKMKQPRQTRQRRNSKEIPAVLVANALRQENLVSELELLKATLNLHSLTNQCGDELLAVWGTDKSHRHSNLKPASSPDDMAYSLEDELSAESPLQDGTSPTPGFDTSTSMKVIKREMRKVHALHEAIMPKSIVPGASTRQRSPSRRSEEDIDPAEQMRARRKRGGRKLNNRFLSKKALVNMETIAIKGPKLVNLGEGYKYDFTGLLELCEIIPANTILTSLDISDNWIQPTGAKKLLGPSLKTATRLTHLDLTRNDLRWQGMKALGPALGLLSGLRSLVLADNNIGDNGASALAGPLKTMTALDTLNLDLNGIGTEGLLALGPSFMAITRLKSLDLSGNVTRFSHESSEGPEFMGRLMPSLCEFTNLTHLGLASNVLMLGGAKVLARVLGDLRYHLVSLDLGGRLGAHNRIGAQGMKTISAGLFWTPLVVLDMSYNDLGTEGANSLALVLSIHTSLTEVRLCGNMMGSVGVRAMMGSLVKHQQLRVLDLSDNKMNSEAFKYVCEGLLLLTAIEKLSIGHNRLVAAKDILTSSVDYEGIDMFTNIMLNSHLTTKIQSLDLMNSNLDRHALRGMVRIVKTLTSLQTLNGLDLGSANADIKLPSKLENYELIYVSQRLMQIDGPNIKRISSVQGAQAHEAGRRKVDLSDFTSIDLSFCGFNTFPGVLERLRNLREMDLSGNQLMNVPMKTVLKFASLHDIILKDCPMLLHPPRAIAAKNQVVEYLHECKLREDNFKVPLIVFGERDEVLQQFLEPISVIAAQVSARNVDRIYAPQDTPKDACKGMSSEKLPTEIRWSPNNSKRTFSLIPVAGTARSAVCSPFVIVQRSISVYTIRHAGHLDRLEVHQYLDMLYEENKCSVVVVVIVHNGEADYSDMEHRVELVEVLFQQWIKMKKISPEDPCLLFQTPVCVDTGDPESYNRLGLVLAAASENLIPEEGDWVHPVVAKMEDELANIALRGHVWISWRIFFSKLNAALDAWGSPLMCVQTVVEVLHAKGAIRCVGPTKDPDTFEKPVLDTVFVNTYKMAVLMSHMPEEAKSWKEWQIVEYMRTLHKKSAWKGDGAKNARLIAKLNLFAGGPKSGSSSEGMSARTDELGLQVKIQMESARAPGLEKQESDQEDKLDHELELAVEEAEEAEKLLETIHLDEDDLDSANVQENEEARVTGGAGGG